MLSRSPFSYAGINRQQDTPVLLEPVDDDLPVCRVVLNATMSAEIAAEKVWGPNFAVKKNMMCAFYGPKHWIKSHQNVQKDGSTETETLLNNDFKKYVRCPHIDLVKPLFDGMLFSWTRKRGQRKVAKEFATAWSGV
jgi:hypothetical protein